MFLFFAAFLCVFILFLFVCCSSWQRKRLTYHRYKHNHTELHLSNESAFGINKNATCNVYVPPWPAMSRMFFHPQKSYLDYDNYKVFSQRHSNCVLELNRHYSLLLGHVQSFVQVKSSWNVWWRHTGLRDSLEHCINPNAILSTNRLWYFTYTVMSLHNCQRFMLLKHYIIWLPSPTYIYTSHACTLISPISTYIQVPVLR